MNSNKWFVVVEGIDHTGKTTLCRNLAQTLGCHVQRFPDRTTPIGKVLHQLLQGTTTLSQQLESQHLLFVANRWECFNTLEQVRPLVCDRYVTSGVAYTAARMGLLDHSCPKLSWLKNTDEGLPKPDLIILLDGVPEILSRERVSDPEIMDSLELQESARKWFKKLLTPDENSLLPTKSIFYPTCNPPVVMINAHLSNDEILKRALETLKLVLRTF